MFSLFWKSAMIGRVPLEELSFFNLKEVWYVVGLKKSPGRRRDEALGQKSTLFVHIKRLLVLNVTHSKVPAGDTPV